jgi:arylsulfatase
MTRIAAFCAALVAALGLAGRLPAAERPNIVVILSDDMGFSDLGCYGGEINTPNLDRLAAGGVRFTQFYNTARCCPTRASLLTGLYPHQAGVGHMMQDHGEKLPGYRGNLNTKCATIAEVLRPAGYGTYAVGKWHVTHNVKPDGPKHNWPLQRGFDRFYGIVGGGANYFDPFTLCRDNTQISAFADPRYKPKTYYLTDAIGDHAARFIGEHTRKHADKPFFMYVAFTAAHWPMQALPEDIAKYKGKYDGGYEPTRKARYEKAVKLGLIDPKQGLSPQAGDWDAVKNKAREKACMEVYAAMVDRMDRNVGKVVAELKRTGQLDNTLVFFLQDNGACAELTGRRPTKNPKLHPDGPRAALPTYPPLAPEELAKAMVLPQTRDGYPIRQGPTVMPGPSDTFIAYGRGWANVSNTPFREYKHWVHEGGISTPLIAHWPKGISAKGELRKQPGHLIDIMATCIDLSGAKYPAGKTPPEGKSLAPAFAGKPIERDAIYWEHEGNRAVRAGKWKLVAKGPGAAWELYDISKDRTEQNDLAAQFPEKLKELVAKWETYAKRANVLPWIWKPPYGETKQSNRPPAGATGVVVAHSPAKSKRYIGSPSLAILPNGEYVASHDFFMAGDKGDTTVVYASADRGQSWRPRAEIKGQWWSTLFVHGGDLYLMGTSRARGNCVIRRSADGGKSWTEPTDADHGLLLADGLYHCAPVPVLVHAGRLWRGMEDGRGPNGWHRKFHAFMMSAPLDADLLKASSWTCSNRLAHDSTWLNGKFGGWLEGNAVATPAGEVVDVLRVQQPGYPERAAIMRVSADGRAATFDPAKDFIPLPGGGKKFTIRFDPVSKQYWSLTNYVPKEHQGTNAAMRRNTLALVRSADLRKWTVARVVVQHPDIKTHGYQYADWQFDGGDIVALVRTASDEPDGTPAHNAHDANYLTFHRVADFRDARD